MSIKIHSESRIPIGDIQTHPDNPRTHDESQIDEIVESMKQFGITAPVLLDENNILLGGEGRLLAARKLGITEMPFVRVTGLTDVQKKAYLIADNKLALKSAWDPSALQRVFDQMQAEGIAVQTVGFSEEELGRLQEDLDKLKLSMEPPEEQAESEEATQVKAYERSASHEAGDSQVVVFSVAVSLENRDKIVQGLKAYQEAKQLQNSAEALVHLAERISTEGVGL